jgi:tetratricopeptide (TPR) repeat protein
LAEHTRRLRVVLVAPDDVDLEIDALKDVIQQANNWRPDAPVDVWWWRTDSGPGLHLEGPQGLADDRMRVADADLVVAVFWARLGTAVHDAPSGTAHELMKSWQAWRAKGRPDVWVYFSTRDVPQHAALDEQFAALNQFRRTLPAEQGTWDFRDSEDLRSTFTAHLGNWLRRQEHVPATEHVTRMDALLAPPSTAGLIQRDEQVRPLAEALKKSGVVSLYGLSGSGKSRLAAQYGTFTDRLRDHQALVWYEVPKSSTLEEMLASLPEEYTGSSDLGINLRAKHLVNALLLRQRLLVLDDFQQGNQASFAPLVSAAAAHGAPGHLLLVSRSALELPDARQLGIHPWSAREVGELLTTLDTPELPDELVEELTEKTGGLPLAVKFFSVLVTSFARNPADLLDGELAQTHLTENWFSEIKSGLSTHELTLLRYFSLALPDITEPVARGSRRAIPDEQGSRALFRLQALMLVEARPNGKWSVHPFVAEHIINDIEDAERRRLLGDLVTFTSSPLVRRHPADITSKELAAAVRSCRYAQQAGDSESAATIIEMISGAAKRLGYYRPLRDLCFWHVLRSETKHPWINFHYAHCQLILGEVRTAITALEALTVHRDDRALNLSVARCLAQALVEEGQADDAVATLREVLATPPGRRKAARSGYEYARMALAQALVAQGTLSEAAQIAQSVVDSTTNLRTEAVALNVLGDVANLRGQHRAIDLFRKAFNKFLEADDRRGMAWAQQHLSDALAVYRPNAWADLRRCVRGVISIRLRSGESSVEYRAWLDRIRTHFLRDHGTLHMIDQEQARLASMVDLL